MEWCSLHTYMHGIGMCLSLLCRHALYTGGPLHVPHIHHCGPCVLPLVDLNWQHQLQLLLCPDTGLFLVTGMESQHVFICNCMCSTYVCIRTCVCVKVCVCAHVCVHVYVYMYMCTCVCVCALVCVHVCVHVYMYMYMCTCVCACVCVVLMCVYV